MPISGEGWELHVVRRSEQDRGEMRRTVGTYAVFHDGEPRAGLVGATVEAPGPGDNDREGNGLRIAAGAYPLATNLSDSFATIGYAVSDDWGQLRRPCLGVGETGARTYILVHPGHAFCASVGCINLTDELASGDDDMAFVESRDRVIAVIDDLRAYLGAAFPGANGEPIPRARLVVDGEP